MQPPKVKVAEELMQQLNHIDEWLSYKFHNRVLDLSASAKRLTAEKRGHFGISSAGHSCKRYLWLTYRWCYPNNFSANVLRLFERGHLEELRVIAQLERLKGVKVYDLDALGESKKVGEGQLNGTPDGYIYGAEGRGESILEIKTCNKRSMEKFQSQGVYRANSTYYSQAQIYMHYTGLKQTLFFISCKDNDNIYAEWVEYLPRTARALVNRAKGIITSTEAPAPLMDNTSPCFFCAAKEVCHNRQSPEISCRSCDYSTPTLEGWRCSLHNKELNIEEQSKACRQHKQHTDLYG